MVQLIHFAILLYAGPTLLLYLSEEHINWALFCFPLSFLYCSFEDLETSMITDIFNLFLLPVLFLE